MVLKFKQKADGVPVEIDVEQPDGTVKTINLFLATNENNLTEIMDKASRIQDEAKDIMKRYPALNNGIDDIEENDVHGLKEIITGATELIRKNYDDLFGEGTFDKLSSAGLGLIKLMPLLDELSISVFEEAKKEADKANKESDKRKAELLMKAKKKRK
ncbi:hypothetical protein [Latilactobacillus curvatus]|uniref:hypothetical protein n=1 Tax=Latilactobacillus curvatus TaxID=28038 RepID=UPI00280BEED3|nr:hypothetical protein [Latilactobacillus curvatus]